MEKDTSMDPIIDENAFRERLLDIVKALGGRDQAASTVQMSAQQLGKWLRGEARPAFFPVVQLCLAAGRSLEWLVTGAEGEAAKVRWQLGGGLQAALSEIGKLDYADLVLIPVLDVRLSAGHGGWNERSEKIGSIPFRGSYLRQLGVEPRSVHAVHASGDSMFPTIADGAAVLIDTSKREVVGDGIYAFVLDSYARIKRIQKGMDGSLNFLSDNAALYPPERLPGDRADGLEIVGRAFWCEREL